MPENLDLGSTLERVQRIIIPVPVRVRLPAAVTYAYSFPGGDAGPKRFIQLPANAGW
jgi:hypothetical protein